mmetsp:Transcript_24477/g.56378  ORF Transcript_24477/g.56378 Transcript_24477/m.56378 type:complete len:233 (-) Transcript_24477:434-1132(-)
MYGDELVLYAWTRWAICNGTLALCLLWANPGLYHRHRGRSTRNVLFQDVVLHCLLLNHLHVVVLLQGQTLRHVREAQGGHCEGLLNEKLGSGRPQSPQRTDSSPRHEKRRLICCLAAWHCFCLDEAAVTSSALRHVENTFHYLRVLLHDCELPFDSCQILSTLVVVVLQLTLHLGLLPVYVSDLSLCPQLLCTTSSILCLRLRDCLPRLLDLFSLSGVEVNAPLLLCVELDP